jgi:hypothetical protein
MANTSIGAQALLHVIKLKRAKVITLLLKYGVVINSGANDLDIAMKVTDLCKTSSSFYNEFMKLLLDPEVLGNVYAGMDGYSNAGGSLFTPSTFDISNSAVLNSSYCDKPENKGLALCKGKSTSTTTASIGTSTSWLKDALNIAQTGFNGYLQLDTNKTNRALADASVKVVEAGGTTNPLPTTKSNTTLYVVLGLVGVSVLGLLTYLITKKKV